MGLIDKMIHAKTIRLTEKLIRLNFQLEYLQDERDEMRANLGTYIDVLKFEEQFYEDKISSTQRKIEKAEKSLVKNFDKYNKRNNGGIFDMILYSSGYECDE